MNAVTLTGGTVVSSLEPVRLVPGDVVVEDGRVASIGPAPPGTASRDCSGCLVIPGNVCAHHHLYSSLARGMPYRLDPPRNFVEILRRVWWRLDRALDDEAVWASAVVGGAAAILNGTTTVIDHHASPNAADGSLDLIASVLTDLGVRSVLCYEVSDRDGPERADTGLEENRRFLKSEWPLSRGMVGAHASFTMSEETLAACVDLARSQGAGIHVHVAEDEADQRDAQARFGKRVGERLAAAGALDDRALLAHCVHLDERERGAIRSAGASVVHNATSNMNNSVGHAPVRSFDRLAVGTDGVGGDMFAEAKTAYWRAREVDSSIAPSWILARMADSAGVAARAFGEPLIGRIEPGAPADLVVLAYDTPTPLSAENLAGHWAFGLGARHVRDVMVGGEWSVLDRTLARVDAAELTLRCREAAARLWERLDHVAEHPFVPAGSS
ncbi:MAG TPA: amidohydrolase family protein [Actinomycetota bacterium]